MSSFLFLNPWLLAGLAALPALWFLLRVMPPAPKRVFLPSARFLDGLVPKTQTPSKTPWWILLMRLMIAALVIIAFAQPVLNPSQAIQGDKPIRIIMDNSWAAADQWDEQIRTAQDILAQAGRRGLSVTLHTTAPEANGGMPLSLGPLSADEALSRVKGLEPLPWHSDFGALNRIVKEAAQETDNYYLSSGVGGSSFDDVIRTLGGAQIYTPQNERLPLALGRGDDKDGNPGFVIHASDAMPKGTPITLQALGQNGRVLGIQSVTLDDTRSKAVMDLPDVLRRDLTRVRIVGRDDAASTYLFGDQFQKKSVGIAAPHDNNAQPFIEASFYLTRALEPYADLKTGDLDTLLSANVSMIILPDIGALSPTQLNRLEEWVSNGGLLLRFAGSTMQQTQQHFLLPTPLRQGTRSLDGALTWENPPKLSGFSAGSPLEGIEIGEDIIIKQQLLAQPAPDLGDKTWASLDDGTPLITADRRDAGMIVMVHTAASPDWSNLPLSGVFVQILNRLVSIAGSAPGDLQDINGAMEPLRVLDGYGQLVAPESNAQVIAAKDFEKTTPSYEHPPGIYGQGSVQSALNLGDDINAIATLSDGGSGVVRRFYDAEYETNLLPDLIIAAFVLLMIDWLVMIILSGRFSMRRMRHAGMAGMIVVFGAVFGVVGTAPAFAQSNNNFKYADGFYLGFIKSANAGLNAQTRAGMEALKDALTRRTSAEPDGVAALDAENDELSFFLLLYWPVDASDKALSDKALRNVQKYLDNGGTILFDTREDVSSADPTRGGANAAALAEMIKGLNVPALAPIKDDHVLGRSFYLLDNFPGRYVNGTIWVEGNSENGRDGVSSVLIGSNDWGSAWQSYGAQNNGLTYRSSGSPRQRELAMRFGVNMVMYALTGNYKADQVHVKYILERLGQ